MNNLTEIAKRAVEDYGFRQIALWSPDDLVEQWGLSPREAGTLKGALRDELERLPVPVEPRDYAAVTDRLNSLISGCLG